MRFFDRRLEGGQIDLAQGALIDDGINVVAVIFLVVACKVLDSRAHSLALHAFDVSDGGAGCEKWVLAKILEVSAAHRGTIDIHSWSEHEVDAAGARVLTDDRSHALGKVRIPGCSETDAAKRCGRPIVTNAEGAVRHFQRGQANVLDLVNVEIVGAPDEIDFLLKRKLLEHRIRARFNGRSRERRRLRP